MTFETLVYTRDGPIATITLNRPSELNTIVPPMPEEFEAAITLAVKDASIKVIILRGAGHSFCAGYDFGEGFHLWDEHITTNGAWDAGKDFAWSTAQALAPTQKFMSMWRAPKPVRRCTAGALAAAATTHCAPILSLPAKTQGSERRTRGCGDVT
jgi:enoyl-CoA hydratase